MFKKVISKNSEKGLSTIELLIAMAVFLIVMSSVYGILKIGNMSRTNINSRSENIKNVRMAVNSIGREAVNAGLGYNRIGGTVPDDFTTENFGLPADADTNTDLLTAISSGFNIKGSTLSKNGEKNDVVAFAFRDFQFNDGFPIVIKDVEQDGDKLILITPDDACANCRPFDLFLIETGNGKQAVILSTDIVKGNKIVLGDAEPLNINYGKKNKDQEKAKKAVEDAKKNLEKEKQSLIDILANLTEALLKGVLNIITQLQGKVNEAKQKVAQAEQRLSQAQAVLAGFDGQSNGSSVKKCQNGNKVNCIDYAATSVIAKKIYLVSYSIGTDGTLIRTTYGNNTGATADEQIVNHPIAGGIRSFKLQYLMSDGTVTEDPSVSNTQKEKCNDIVQIEVAITVESETDQNGVLSSEPITLTSTFSTRNLKYDVY